MYDKLIGVSWSQAESVHFISTASNFRNFHSPHRRKPSEQAACHTHDRKFASQGLFELLKSVQKTNTLKGLTFKYYLLQSLIFVLYKKKREAFIKGDRKSCSKE